MPKVPSGTPTYPTRSAFGSAKAGEVLQTVDVDRGCFSCALGGPDGRTLFIAATDWRGPEAMFQGEPTGQILAVEVECPAAVSAS